MMNNKRKTGDDGLTLTVECDLHAAFHALHSLLRCHPRASTTTAHNAAAAALRHQTHIPASQRLRAVVTSLDVSTEIPEYTTR